MVPRSFKVIDGIDRKGKISVTTLFCFEASYYDRSDTYRLEPYIESEIDRKLSRNICFFGKYLRFDTCINSHISHLWRHFGDKVLAKNYNNFQLR